jgi:ABC-2 type transport system ATP-binding protein
MSQYDSGAAMRHIEERFRLVIQRGAGLSPGGNEPRYTLALYLGVSRGCCGKCGPTTPAFGMDDPARVPRPRKSPQSCTATNSSGGRSVPPGSSSETYSSVTAAATLRLSRHGGGSGNSHNGRAWQVLIDGSVVGSLRNNEAVDLPLEAGHHGVQVTSMRFLRSPKDSFDLAEGQVIGLSCRRRPRHPFIVQRSIILLVVSLFKHDVWISLIPDDTVEIDLEAGGNALRTEAADASRSPDSTRAITSVKEITSTPTLDGKGGPAALAVQQLTKRFGQRTAFSEVSFEVAYGEVFGFLGPNGAGKTTTVRTLGTLIAPTSGSATVAGIPLSPENGVEIRQRIAIMPEAPGLYLRLTVTENLEYFAGLYGLHNPGPRIEEALEAVNLANRAGDLCGGLSKGLRQRVGLARTLLSDPAVMFLDEPTSGLDPVAAREVHDLIIGLRQRGVTIFLTTHRLDEAEKLCDRVAIMNSTLRTVGTPAGLREQLFEKSLVVSTVEPVKGPEQLFSSIKGVESWRADGPASYVLSVSEPKVAAPEVVRGLVNAGADVLTVGETQHSLEDVYLELIAEDAAAHKP